MATKVFAGVGIAAAAFAAVSVKAAVEAADAQLKLQNTFKNNEMLSDRSVAAFNRQADALRDLTGVDDEAITTAQALVGQFELTGAQVQKLTPLIVDLSAKMGIDLQAAAKAVGKATQGSAGILSRYGIILDETALEADAFNAVMTGLQGTVGGFAKERAINEPWRVLGAQLEEIAETVGTALLPIIRELVKTIQAWLPAIEAVLVPLGKVIALAGEALTVVGHLLSLDFNALKSGFEEASATFEQLITRYNEGEISALELSNALARLQQETGTDVQLTKELEAALNQATDGARRARQASMEWNQILENQQDELADTTRETHRLTDAQRENQLATLALTNQFFAIQAAADDVTAAQRKLNQMQENGKTDTKAYEQAVTDAILAQAGLEEAVFSYAQELVDAGKKQGDVERKIRALASEFGLTRQEIEPLIDRIRDYINELNRIPSNVSTTLTTRHVSVGGTTGGLTKFQHGGIVTRPTIGLVGEAGPEAVIPLERAGALGGIQGDIVLQVDGRELTRITRNEINRLAGRNATSRLRT